MYRLALITLIFCACLVPAHALAEQNESRLPRGSYIFTPDAPIRSLVRAINPLLVYLNRDGGTYFCGSPNDSSNNISTVACQNGASGTLSPSTLTDAEWNDVVRCVTIQFGRFGIVITDQDPMTTPHLEAVVAGNASQLGFVGAGGVAPFTCGLIEQAVVYTFQQAYGHNTRAICETTAQEVAHAFGLDHEYLCTDPMTYLDGCGDKWFQDVFASCGESTPRPCSCTMDGTQNSVRHMLSLLGAGEDIPPVVSIISPINGAEVDPLFRIAADASDNTLVNFVEFWIDGELARSVKLPPYEIMVQLPVGAHTIDAKAVDQALNEATATTTITVVPQCATDPDCGGTLICADSLCVGGFGTPCQTQSECDAMLSCAEESGERLCTRSCTPGGNACPGGFSCLEGEFGGAKCWPSSGGGCEIGASREGTLGSLLVLLAGLTSLLVVRSRRSPTSRR